MADLTNTHHYNDLPHFLYQQKRIATPIKKKERKQRMKRVQKRNKTNSSAMSYCSFPKLSCILWYPYTRSCIKQTLLHSDQHKNTPKCTAFLLHRGWADQSMYTTVKAAVFSTISFQNKMACFFLTLFPPPPTTVNRSMGIANSETSQFYIQNH